MVIKAWLTREMDAAGDARVGVGFITWSMAKDPRLLDLVLERRPPAVMLSFGEVRPYAEKIKHAGALLICQVQTLEQAKDAVASGADVLVAQGAEAGGHGISRGTFSFVPAVVDAARGSPVAARRRRSGRPRARRRPDAGGGRRSGWHSLLFHARGCGMKRNALTLAQAARILKLPVVLTSSIGVRAGPLLSELEGVLPAEFAARIKRVGIVDAMDDENSAAAVRATGRKKLIIAGVTNDVCTVYPALHLVREGYKVQVVADAGGSPTKMGDDIALRRMERGGVTLTSTIQVIAELSGDWTTPEGGQLVQVVMEALQA
jgi:nicotinamidase-related amidase